jgi:hypothetical protein
VGPNCLHQGKCVCMQYLFVLTHSLIHKLTYSHPRRTFWRNSRSFPPPRALRCWRSASEEVRVCVRVCVCVWISLVCIPTHSCTHSHSYTHTLTHRCAQGPRSPQDQPEGEQDRLHELPAGLSNTLCTTLHYTTLACKPLV